MGTSLGLQCLRLCAATAGGGGAAQEEGRFHSPHGATKEGGGGAGIGRSLLYYDLSREFFPKDPIKKCPFLYPYTDFSTS